MAEKMLVTQALDERDLLVKKIGDKIAKASFTDVKKHNEEKVMERYVKAFLWNGYTKIIYGLDNGNIPLFSPI